MDSEQDEYCKNLLELYRKVYHAVDKYIEYDLELTRSEALEIILNKSFIEPKESLVGIKKILRTNIELFFARKMTVNQVEDLIIKK
jgi:hypothetical protein